MPPLEQQLGLGFLFSLGVFPIKGCPHDGDDDSTTVAASTTSPDTDPTSDSSTGTGDATSEETGAGLCDVPITPVCQAMGDKYAECYPQYPNPGYAQDCACDLYEVAMELGPECGAAHEDWYACIGMLTCEVIESGDPTCVPERMAVDAICDFGEDDEGGTSDGG